MSTETKNNEFWILSQEFMRVQHEVLSYTSQNFNIGHVLENFPIKTPKGAVIIPSNSFGGKSWRIQIRKNDILLSVYLDLISGETVCGGIHFEVYNMTTAKEPKRFKIDEVKEFNKHISQQLNYKYKIKNISK